MYKIIYKILSRVTLWQCVKKQFISCLELNLIPIISHLYKHEIKIPKSEKFVERKTVFNIFFQMFYRIQRRDKFDKKKNKKPKKNKTQHYQVYLTAYIFAVLFVQHLNNVVLLEVNILKSKHIISLHFHVSAFYKGNKTF